MKKEENKEQNELEIMEKEDMEVHTLIQGVGELLGCLLFTIIFGGGGILAMIQKDSDITIKIVGGIFIMAGIGLGYKGFCCVKVIKEKISSMKKKQKIVITLRNVGYFIYSMAFMTIMVMFIKAIVTPDSESLTVSYGKYFIMIVLEAIIGTVLMYIDSILSVLHKKTNIVEIDNNKEE